MVITNMKQLEVAINKLSKQALQQYVDVRDVVAEVGSRHVQSDVYAVYPDPKQYERTFELSDEDSFVKENTADGIAIYNTRSEDGKDIPSIIEYGEGYSYSGYGYAYEQPRPFMENTKKELEQTGTHIDAFAKSLKKLGVEVKR